MQEGGKGRSRKDCSGDIDAEGITITSENLEKNPIICCRPIHL